MRAHPPFGPLSGEGQTQLSQYNMTQIGRMAGFTTKLLLINAVRESFLFVSNNMQDL